MTIDKQNWYCTAKPNLTSTTKVGIITYSYMAVITIKENMIPKFSI